MTTCNFDFTSRFKLILVVVGLAFFGDACAQSLALADAQAILEKVIGEKEIHARIWNAAEKKFLDIKGAATFSKVLNSQYIREQFQLNFGDKLIKGTAYVRFSKTYNRFELIQVDAAASSSIVLTGLWDDKLQQLVFVPLENFPQWGSKGTLALRWAYSFKPDGSFVKEMHLPDESKQYILQSDYTYTSIKQASDKNLEKYEHHTVPVQDGTLHYQTVGQGRTIVISNGGPSWTCEHIELFGKEVAALGYRVILYDQRGTGQSVLKRTDSTTVTISNMVADLEQLRSHLNLKTWTVMGHSFGSMLSAIYASRFPNATEKLVLLSPPGTDLTFLSDYQANLNIRLSSEELENISFWAAPEKMNEQPERAAYEQVINTLPAFVYDKSQLPLLKTAINTTTYNIKVAQLVWNDLLKMNYDITNQVKKFKNRCLVIAGRQDALSQRVIEQTANRFSKSELHWLDECAHILWTDQPDKLYEILSGFLKLY